MNSSLTRRAFLGSAALGAGALVVAPSSLVPASFAEQITATPLYAHLAEHMGAPLSFQPAKPMEIIGMMRRHRDSQFAMLNLCIRHEQDAESVGRFISLETSKGLQFSYLGDFPHPDWQRPRIPLVDYVHFIQYPDGRITKRYLEPALPGRPSLDAVPFL
ncbi:hypothetical protein EXS73_02025 [Candidatus Pacearchaeota archaeon]|nr:hypothetical protein [Candidatus Pacearchaeota archaeon]